MYWIFPREINGGETPIESSIEVLPPLFGGMARRVVER
jgi:hypothetical protein